MEYPILKLSKLFKTIILKISFVIVMVKFIRSVVIILVLCFISTVVMAQAAQSGSEQKVTDDTDLSGINWDEEETTEEINTDDLSNMSWEDEPALKGSQTTDFSETDWGAGEESETSAEDDDFFKNVIKNRAAIEKREMVTHIWGFLLFVFYLTGGIFTAYFTRDRKLSVHYAPELLILLHTFWPLEWLCLLFAGKKVR